MGGTISRFFNNHAHDKKSHHHSGSQTKHAQNTAATSEAATTVRRVNSKKPQPDSSRIGSAIELDTFPNSVSPALPPLLIEKIAAQTVSPPLAPSAATSTSIKLEKLSPRQTEHVSSPTESVSLGQVVTTLTSVVKLLSSPRKHRDIKQDNSPFLNLPNELIIHILILLGQGVINATNTSNADIVNLTLQFHIISQVCRRLRNFILDKHLYTNIVPQGISSMPIKRSASTPLISLYQLTFTFSSNTTSQASSGFTKLYLSSPTEGGHTSKPKKKKEAALLQFSTFPVAIHRYIQVLEKLELFAQNLIGQPASKTDINLLPYLPRFLTTLEEEKIQQANILPIESTATIPAFVNVFFPSDCHADSKKWLTHIENIKSQLTQEEQAILYRGLVKHFKQLIGQGQKWACVYLIALRMFGLLTPRNAANAFKHLDANVESLANQVNSSSSSATTDASPPGFGLLLEEILGRFFEPSQVNSRFDYRPSETANISSLSDTANQVYSYLIDEWSKQKGKPMPRLNIKNVLHKCHLLLSSKSTESSNFYDEVPSRPCSPKI